MGENDNIELVAKLKLDTTDAEEQLASLTDKSGKSKSKSKAVKATLPKDTKIELPKGVGTQLKEIFTGDKGLANVGKVAKDALGGVQSLGNSLAGLVPALGWIAAVIAAIIGLLQGTDTMNAVTNGLEQIITMLREVLAPVLALIGETLLDTVDIIMSLKPIFELITDVVMVSLEPLMHFVKILKPIFELIGKIGAVLGSIISIFSDTLLGIMDSLAEVLINLVDMAIRPLLEILEPVIEFFNNLKDTIQNFITTLTAGFITFDNDMTSTDAVKADYKSSLDSWETSGGHTAYENKQLEESKKTNQLLGWLGEVFQGVGDFLGDVIHAVGNAIKWVLDAVKVVIEAFKIAFDWVSTNILKPIWQGLEWFWNNIILGIWDTIKFIWEKIKEVFTWLGDFFVNMGEVIVDGVKKAWEWIKDTGKNLTSGITASKDAGFGGGLFTEQGRWGDGYQFGDITGSVIDFGAGLVGKGWLWADGGTLDVGAQIWGMNEKGNPEFLFNAGGHDTVINAEILEDAMYRAAVKADKQSGARELKVSIKEGTPAGPRELVQWILPTLKFSL